MTRTPMRSAINHGHQDVALLLLRTCCNTACGVHELAHLARGGEKFKMCAKCRKAGADVFYCSATCQRADWGEPKRVCATVAAAVKAFSESSPD